MSAVVVFILILLLAVGLIALGLGLSRRSRQAERAPEMPSAPPPVELPSEPERREPVDVPAPPTELEVEAPEPVIEELVPRVRLRDRLGKTRAAFARSLGGIRGRTSFGDDVWEDLEDTLLLADVGVPTTTSLVEAVQARARTHAIGTGDELIDSLRTELLAVLDANARRELVWVDGEPNVWMFVGVNGVGKTTTIAKVAQRQVDDGRRVVLAAADTFRAAAAEQLTHWADQVGARIVRGQEGADPGSVVFDAMAAAGGRDADVVLVDTAGRLHTKVNLMAELEKLRRIVERTPGALKEVLLVLDATTGQNGLNQARQFAESVDVTGVVLTKLDGSAKGGIVLAIEAELGIPVKLVGVGETPADLLDFHPEAFVDALLDADGGATPTGSEER